MLEHNELFTMNKEKEGNVEDGMARSIATKGQLEETSLTIMELRDLLTFVKGYKQLIHMKHPEVKEFEHWDEMDADIDAMAERLTTYERSLSTVMTNA